MEVYYNISHLIHRLYLKKNISISKGIILRILDKNYNLNSTIDVNVLIKLSEISNSNLFDFINIELDFFLIKLNVNTKKEYLINELIYKFKKSNLTEENIINGLCFRPLFLNLNKKKKT